MSQEGSILVLGGYGRAGLAIARQLVRHSGHSIRLAGPDPVKASAAARELNSMADGERVTWVEVNAALKTRLVPLFKKVDLVIAAVPLAAAGEKIARAALEAGVHCVDLRADGKDRKGLEELDHAFREAGLTYLFGAGFASGAPQVMARYAAGHFDRVGTLTIDGPYRKRRTILPGTGFPVRGKERFKDPSGIRSITVTAAGISGGRRERMQVTVGHQNACQAAALSTVPCVLGVLDGSLRRPGVHLMGRVLDPERYLENLWDTGMTVSVRRWPGPKKAACPTECMHLIRCKDLPVY